MKTRAYMDLTTDYAFKRVFASENNKDLLISLIRQGGTYDVSLKRKWDQEAARQLQEQQLETAIKQSLDEGMKKGLETGVKRGIKEGVEKGMKAGIEEGIAHRNASIVRRLISHGDWSDEYIADLAEVSINYVRRVRKEIADEEGRS